MLSKQSHLNWEKTSEDYSNWVSNNKIKNFFLKNIFIKDCPIWWITDLSNKDNVLDNKWFYNLKNFLYENKKIQFNKNTFYFILLAKFFKNFIKDIFWCILIKILGFFVKKKINDKKYCFHSFEYNFIESDKAIYDKLYNHVPLKKNHKKNFYLISIIFKKEFFFNIFKNIKRLNKQKIDFVFADKYIDLKTILEVYFYSFLTFIKLIKFIKQNSKIFQIKKKDCYNVLYPLLLKSFGGNIQSYLLQSLSINNCLKKINCKLFVNYGEFHPGYRSTYFFLKKNFRTIKSISIQHGYSNKNMLFFRHEKKDFSSSAKYINSPRPDYYFVMGLHYKKILKKFYPGKIKMIGSLRYDTTNFKKIINIKKTKSILICSTTGDEDSIISQLNKCNIKNYNLIVSPHPAHFESSIKKFKNDLAHNFSYYKEKSSIELMKKSHLTISGYSSLGFESIFFGVPSIRIISPEHPYFFDLQDGVPNITNHKQLNSILNNFSLIKKQNIKKIIKNIFFKLDNRAHKRFWMAINSIEKKKDHEKK